MEDNINAQSTARLNQKTSQFTSTDSFDERYHSRNSILLVLRRGNWRSIIPDHEGTVLSTHALTDFHGIVMKDIRKTLMIPRKQ